MIVCFLVIQHVSMYPCTHVSIHAAMQPCSMDSEDTVSGCQDHVATGEIPTVV